MRRARFDDAGFNLVELVVVIVIIAVLAAIAIPLYIDHRRKANDSAAQSDAMNLGILIRAAYDEDEDGGVTVSTAADGSAYTIDGEAVLGMSPGVDFVRWVGGDIDEWCVQLKHPDGYVSSDPGVRFDSANGYVENAACVAPPAP